VELRQVEGADEAGPGRGAPGGGGLGFGLGDLAGLDDAEPPAATMKPSARSKACARVPSSWAASTSNSSGASISALIIATIAGVSQYIEPAGKASSPCIRISTRASICATRSRLEPHQSGER
jgi:hypothetical protein